IHWTRRKRRRGAMEAVPRMPMIWLDLKEAGEFQFGASVRQSAVNVTRDFEGCSTLRKYFGQLHYLQSRVPLGAGQEAAVPISWTEIFSGKTVTHDDICYEQACILYNLGALHSMLGAMDNRVSEEGMKVSCTHFQCSAGAFSYLRDHFNHNYSSMLDNRKSFLVARISAQVVDYYKEACRALENSETASLLGKIQKDWKKLVQMKIYYFAAIAHLHMGKQAEEQQKYGERGQPDSVQEALRFTMDVIGGKFNSAKKDNDFIYHEPVPALDTLPSVKGAPLVKGLPVNPTDPSVTGPDIFSKLVPMAAHEASSLYSEEKAKLLRDVMAKIESKNETLNQFMDSLCLDSDSVDNLDMYSHIPAVLMEKCAALSVRPDTVKSLTQSMQALSGVFTDVEASLREIGDVLNEDESGERSLEATGAKVPPRPATLAELRRDLDKYLEAHEKASFTNTELHRAMNLHVPNLRLLGGPLDALREALPRPQLSEGEEGQGTCGGLLSTLIDTLGQVCSCRASSGSELRWQVWILDSAPVCPWWPEEVAAVQCMKRILGKVQEMRDQRSSLEKQLRELIQQDDITAALVTTDRTDMKRLFEEQLKKYEQVKIYIDQNLSAQENILKALTEANVQYALVRKGLVETEHKWNSTVQMLVASYEAYEDLMKKSQEGREFYEDLEGKASRLLERAHTLCKTREEERQVLLERELQKKAPPRPTAPKPALQKKASDMDVSCGLEDPELAQINAAILSLGGDLPEELRSLPPELPFPGTGAAPVPSLHWPGVPAGVPATIYAPPRLPAHLAQLPHHPSQQVAGYPPAGLPRGGAPHIQSHFPQVPAPQLSSVSSISPQAQPCPPGAAMALRPSTTTVDCVQTPIPSYSPAPGLHIAQRPLPPVVSSGIPIQQPQPPQTGLPMQQQPCQPHSQYQSGPAQLPLHVQPQYPQYVPPAQQPVPPRLQQPAFPSRQLPPHLHPGIPHQPSQPGYPPQAVPRPLHMMPGAPSPPSSQTPLLPHAAHPQIPPSSQAVLPRAPPPAQPQIPPAVPLSQPPVLPGIVPHPTQVPPVSGPSLPLPGTLPPQQPGPGCYPGGAPMMPPQPTSQASCATYSAPPPRGPLQHLASMGPQPLPQHMIPPSTGPSVTQQPGAMLPSAALSPSPAPSPGPSSLGLVPQRPPPSPSLTPVGGAESSSPPPPPTSSSSSLFQRSSSSTDDLLSSSPEGQHGGPKAAANVLLPTKADPQDGQRRREPAGVRLIEGDPYGTLERTLRLQAELEHFAATVQALERVAELDALWRELQELQERDVRQLSIAVARCYSMKNRRQDVMPYDCNRVLLRSGKDDYINASSVEELSPYCPRFIATQAPLPGTAADFWLMVYEQKVSLVVMLVSEQELEKVSRVEPHELAKKVPWYFPSERGQQLSQGPITLTLTTQKTTPTHVERMISMQYRDQSLKRTVIHLQFTSWPELTSPATTRPDLVHTHHSSVSPSGLPESQSNLIRFIQEVHTHYLHQRPLHTPVVVHCSSGVGRTGAFCLLYAALQELEAGNGIADLPLLVRKMRQQRKNMLQEKPTPSAANHHPGPTLAAPLALGSASSSLELLASLTPEAFTLDSSCRGKSRISKQSFLHPHEGQGLQGAPSSDDPLSTLDPLWSLNKS
ncbi:tyrosine-protein phosphatase non-receptor type 23-like, partial [Scleropages formosus]